VIVIAIVINTVTVIWIVSVILVLGLPAIIHWYDWSAKWQNVREMNESRRVMAAWRSLALWIQAQILARLTISIWKMINISFHFISYHSVLLSFGVASFALICFNLSFTLFSNYSFLWSGYSDDFNNRFVKI
jgi:hypothetical protein